MINYYRILFYDKKINKIIFSLETDEDIIEFVHKRIAELENNSVETTLG